jgi:hypothetical protein
MKKPKTEEKFEDTPLLRLVRHMRHDHWYTVGELLPVSGLEATYDTEGQPVSAKARLIRILTGNSDMFVRAWNEMRSLWVYKKVSDGEYSTD